MKVEERSASLVTVTVGEATAEVPRYWLARMLFRVGLHGLRLGYIETYGGFFIDDRADGPVQMGVRNGEARASVAIPRGEALAFVERVYRAVAPVSYLERPA